MMFEDLWCKGKEKINQINHLFARKKALQIITQI